MESNKKGNSLFGNICHQFEDFIQNVDDFVTKGPVKCVESQVHNVGASVKKLYADVKDKLPVKNVMEQETPPTAKKINVIDDLLVMEQSSINHLRANESMPIKHHAPQIIKPHITDSSRELINDLPSGKNDDSSTKDADYGFEYYITRDLIPESANTNSDKKSLERCVDHNTSMPSMAVSPSNSISNADVSVVRKEMFDDFSHNECPRSNISTDDCLFGDELMPIVKPYDLDDDEVHEKKNLAMDPLISSALNTASVESAIFWDNFPADDACVDISCTSQSMEFVVSHFSCDDDAEENTGFVSSTCSASPETSNVEEFITENITHNVENMCNDHIVSSGHASAKESTTVEFISEHFTHKVENMCNGPIDYSEHTSPKASPIVEFISEESTQKVENICNDQIECNEHARTSSTPSSCTTLAYETEAVDMLSLMNSNDVISSATSESTVGLSQSGSEHCKEDAHSKYDFLRSEIGSSPEFGVGVTDCELETVDLSNNVILDKKNLHLNCNFPHPTSHRSRDFSYYKNLVQDAFASKKRLVKEYQDFGILYSDIDEEARLNFGLNSLHSCPKHINEASTSSLGMSEWDWELL